MDLAQTVVSYRLHNQGVPNQITYNKKFPPKETLLTPLRNIGHFIKSGTSDCVTQTVAKQQGRILAMSDPRKNAEADGY